MFVDLVHTKCVCVHEKERQREKETERVMALPQFLNSWSLKKQLFPDLSTVVKEHPREVLLTSKKLLKACL